MMDVYAKRKLLVALARREGLSAEEALDCVHDALCTWLQKGTGDIEGYVVNTARNKRRRHHLSQPHDVDVEVADDRPTIEAMLSHAEECMRLHACVGRLCDKQRTVVMLRLLEERDGEDVAQQLGVSRAYVDVLLHRAKASLFVCMRDSDHSPDERSR